MISEGRGSDSRNLALTEPLWNRYHDYGIDTIGRKYTFPETGLSRSFWNSNSLILQSLVAMLSGTKISFALLEAQALRDHPARHARLKASQDAERIAARLVQLNLHLESDSGFPSTKPALNAAKKAPSHQRAHPPG